MAADREFTHQASVIGIVLGLMVMNLLAMLYARQILGLIGGATLQIVGAVLGILQIALSVQIILFALSRLGVIPPGALGPQGLPRNLVSIYR